MLNREGQNMYRNLTTRLEALEKRQGATGRQIVVWRYDDEEKYQACLTEAQRKCAPLDSILVVSWLPPQDPPHTAKVLK